MLTRVTRIGRTVPDRFEGTVRAVWRRAMAVAVDGAGLVPPTAGLITLVREDVPMTACSIALAVGPTFDFGSLGLSVGDPVGFDGTTVEVGRRADSAPMVPVPAGRSGIELYDGLVCHEVRCASPGAVEMVTRAAHARRDARHGGSLARIFSARCDMLIDDLERAAACDDALCAESAASSLVGLGPGLTPAGDDALCGFILGRRVARSRDGAADQAIKLVAWSSGGRTSDVSAVQLALAAQGRFGEALLGVAHALDARRPVLVAATDRCLGEGATSGADALLGLVAGVRSASLELARMDA